MIICGHPGDEMAIPCESGEGEGRFRSENTMLFTTPTDFLELWGRFGAPWTLKNGETERLDLEWCRFLQKLPSLSSQMRF